MSNGDSDELASLKQKSEEMATTIASAGRMPELTRLKELSERLVSPELAIRIVDELPDALVAVSNETGEIIYFNRRAELLFGYDRKEVIGRQVEILVPEARRPAHIEHRTKYADDPQARPMGSELLLTARAKNGREFAVKINLSPIPTTEGVFTLAVIRRVESAK